MDETGIDLRALFAVIRRQLKLIFITVLVVMAAALAILLTLTPIYASAALVLFDPSNKNLLDPQTQMTTGAADSARLDSEVELLRSDNLLLKVIAAENLVSDPEFAPSLGLKSRLMAMLSLTDHTPPSGEQALNQTLAKLRSAYSVQRRGLTYLISLQVRSTDPNKAARLANAMADAHISSQLQSKVNAQLASRDVLLARVAQARAEVASSETSFDAFLDSNLERISADTGRDDLMQISRQIEALSTSRIQSLDVIARSQDSLAAGDLQAVVTQLQTDALAQLERERQALTGRLGQPNTTFAVDLPEQIAAIEQQMRSTASAEIDALRSQAAETQSRETALRDDLRQQVLGSPLSASVLTDLYELQQRAELARSHYQTLLSRTQELETQASLQIADSRIVSPALPAGAPAFPNNTTILALALVVAITLGVILAFLYENFIGGFVSEEQAEAVLRAPVATSIPRERHTGEGETLSALMASRPLSMFAESVRRLRATIDQTLRNKGKAGGKGAVVMVTSTLPNEGKTTVALALARSYALAGRKTLLVDCDLREPSIHHHLSVSSLHGLHDYLDGTLDEAQLPQIFVQPDQADLTIVLGARRCETAPDHLLAGPHFPKIIQAAINSFDVIVLDTTPVAPVVDGLFVAGYADIVVFVTRWGTTAQRDAKKAMTRLMSAADPKAAVLTVLNQQSDNANSYGRLYAGS